MQDIYQRQGVSARKEQVHQAVADQSAGLYPGAFCKILPDLAGDPAWCTAMHADGAGTKSALAYLLYRETGSTDYLAGLAQDALVMNTDDLLCIGATDGFLVSNTIGRNAHLIDGACLSALIGGYDTIISQLQELGIDISLTGGETADVGDLVRSLICDSTVLVRLPRKDVIDAARIGPGQVIIGLASAGRTTYETKENSGIGSNGLTAARHLLLHKDYRRLYPETFAETMPRELAYCGPYHLEDKLPGSDLTAGQALVSPTRTYLPVLRQILARLDRSQIFGLIHCTGGGQAKCRGFGAPNVRYVKDNLLPLPAVFAAIRQTGKMTDQELYQVFNMGHRLEIYCAESVADDIIAICAEFDLSARRIGYTEKKPAGPREVLVQANGQTLTYLDD